MSSLKKLLSLIVIFAFAQKQFGLAEPVLAYLPPFELRSMEVDRSPFFMGVPAQRQIPADLSHFPAFEAQPIIKETPQKFTSMKPATESPSPVQAPVVEKEPEAKRLNHSNEVHELLEALGMLHREEEAHGRSALQTTGGFDNRTAEQAREYDYPLYGDHYSYPYSHWPQPYQPYHPPPYAYVPPVYVEPSHYPQAPHIPKPLPAPLPIASKLPVVDLLKAPALTKLGGLISIVKGILSGNIGNTLNGLPSHFIGGILKSLTTYTSSAGGLKTLIAKLSIPLLALVLINVEVLAIVWWMWDDCSESPFKAPSPPSHYNSPPAVSYPGPSPYGYKYR